LRDALTSALAVDVDMGCVPPGKHYNG